MQLGIDVQDVFAAMQIYLGSLYINAAAGGGKARRERLRG
jgi:hypothetical protein